MSPYRNAFRTLVLVVLGSLSSLSLAYAWSTTTLTQTVTIDATVISDTVSQATPPPTPSPISNNGVPLTIDSGTDTAIFRGIAYPGSTISILKNGLVLNELPANADGSFEIPVRNIRPGTYTFGIRAKDSNGLLSTTLSYTIFITANVITEVNNIFIPPTITTDKIEVKQGDTIIFSGRSVPLSDITLNIFAKSGITKIAKADQSGKWTYIFSTKGLDLGDYNSKAKASLTGQSSLYSETILFTVGTTNTPRSSGTLPIQKRCDLNNDGRVNLLDFSIMAFWYKRLGFPAKVDLNSDGHINLTDLSILAYCWTG